MYEDDGIVNFDNVFEFLFVDYVFLFSYVGWKFLKKGGFYYGGNVKVIYWRIGFFVMVWGFGLDLGI